MFRLKSVPFCRNCFSQEVVLTGQENPHFEKPMREDLYKKVMSGDPVPSRLPYAVLTKMISFKGWKRFEMNEPMSFRAVPERSFNSILRRSLVIILKGRFLSADMLSRLRLPPGVRNHESYGYFPTEADLPSFLQSSPAGAAMLRIITGFCSANNQQECERIIEAYAEGGGDLGVTVGTMRQSCNLPPVSAPSRPAAREDTVDSARPPDVPGAAEPATCGMAVETLEARGIPSSIETEADSLIPFHVSLISHCLDYQKDLLSDKGVVRLTANVWSDTDAKRRGEIWAKLLSYGFWTKLPRRGQVVTPLYASH